MVSCAHIRFKSKENFIYFHLPAHPWNLNRKRSHQSGSFKIYELFFIFFPKPRFCVSLQSLFHVWWPKRSPNSEAFQKQANTGKSITGHCLLTTTSHGGHALLHPKFRTGKGPWVKTQTYQDELWQRAAEAHCTVTSQHTLRALNLAPRRGPAEGQNTPVLCSTAGGEDFLSSRKELCLTM